MGRVWNSTIDRKTPLKRGGRLKRSPIKRVNRERAKARRENEKVYGPYHVWISTLPCHFASHECIGVVKGHHVKTVATGGEDYGNEIPLCVQHHTEAHAGRWTREEQREIAAEYAERWSE